MIACSGKPTKSQQSMKKGQYGGSLPASVMSRSLNSSPNKNGKNHHVRFTPEAEKKDSDRRSSLFWYSPQKIQRARCKMLTTDELMTSMKKSPIKVFLSKLNDESRMRNH